ncbi:MAG TPA: 30S ribosomal protein S20 [Candidatus Binataceae bacterium]|nr:30S ribosomal protein S20 [Candidatus Binataceae bacterium]
MPHIPVHPSAEKRHRQSLKRNERNRAIKTRMRTAVKGALEAIAGNDPQAAATEFRTATKLLSQAASKGTIHRNTASRKTARLARKLHLKHAAAKA